jgi:hypothetical protein
VALVDAVAVGERGAVSEELRVGDAVAVGLSVPVGDRTADPVALPVVEAAEVLLAVGPPDRVPEGDAVAVLEVVFKAEAVAVRDPEPEAPAEPVAEAPAVPEAVPEGLLDLLPVVEPVDVRPEVPVGVAEALAEGELEPMAVEVTDRLGLVVEERDPVADLRIERDVVPVADREAAAEVVWVARADNDGAEEADAVREVVAVADALRVAWGKNWQQART